MDCMEHDLNGISKLLHCIVNWDMRIYSRDETDCITRMGLDREMFILNFVIELLDNEDFYYKTVENHLEELMKE